MHVYGLHVVCFLHLFVSSRSCFSPQNKPVLPIKRGIADKHTAQHRPISPPQVALGIIKSFVAPNLGPLISAPFTHSCVLPCASVRATSATRGAELLYITSGTWYSSISSAYSEKERALGSCSTAGRAPTIIHPKATLAHFVSPQGNDCFQGSASRNENHPKLCEYIP